MIQNDNRYFKINVMVDELELGIIKESPKMLQSEPIQLTLVHSTVLSRDVTQSTSLMN